MSDTDNTESQQRGLVPFKSGQSGNPKGRPKGSRNKLNEAFLHDFFEAWQAFGRPALMAAAWEDPVAFVKVAAQLLPQKLDVTVESLTELTDAELDQRIRERLIEAGVEAGGNPAFGGAEQSQDAGQTSH